MREERAGDRRNRNALFALKGDTFLQSWNLRSSSAAAAFSGLILGRDLVLFQLAVRHFVGPGA